MYKLKLMHLQAKYVPSAGVQLFADFHYENNAPKTMAIREGMHPVLENNAITSYEPWIQFPRPEYTAIMHQLYTEIATAWNEKYGVLKRSDKINDLNTRIAKDNECLLNQIKDTKTESQQIKQQNATLKRMLDIKERPKCNKCQAILFSVYQICSKDPTHTHPNFLRSTK